MQHLVVTQTSERRFVAWVLGTSLLAKGTSEQFAVGQLMKEHGHKFGLNVAPSKEMWVWTERMIRASRCAVPVEEGK